MEKGALWGLPYATRYKGLKCKCETAKFKNQHDKLIINKIKDKFGGCRGLNCIYDENNTSIQRPEMRMRREPSSSSNMTSKDKFYAYSGLNFICAETL